MQFFYKPVVQWSLQASCRQKRVTTWILRGDVSCLVWSGEQILHQHCEVVKSLLNQSQHTCDFTINNQIISSHIQRLRLDVSIYKAPLAAASVHIWSHPTLPDQFSQRPDHNTGNYVPYSLRTVNGFFNVPQSYYEQGLRDGTYGLLSLSEKTRKSNHLQMSLQRQHFLPSYLKPWVVVRPGFQPTTSRTVVQYSTKWANQLEVTLLCLRLAYCGGI